MSRRLRPIPVAAVLAILMMLASSGGAAAQNRTCERIITANVVALQEPIWLNRLGANIPGGMMFALARDVVDDNGASCDNGLEGVASSEDPKKPAKSPTRCQQGYVHLRNDKRPRPIVLRANEGDCLKIYFTNLLPDGSPRKAVMESVPESAPESAPGPLLRKLREVREMAGAAQRRREAEAEGKVRPEGKTPPGGPEAKQESEPESFQVSAPDSSDVSEPVLPTLSASIHVQGLPWFNGPEDDGSYVGSNPDSLVDPGHWTSYTLFAEHEGSYLLYSTADDWTSPPPGGNADGGSLAQGLFGAVNIQPSESDVKPYKKEWDSEWYRSQVTEQDLCLALANRDKDKLYDPDTGVCTPPDAPPVIDYQALYPKDYKPNPSLSNLPVLNMLCTPTAAQLKACQLNEIVHTDLTAIITGPKAGPFPFTLNPANQPPALRAIALLPDRLQPYRELTIIYHESFAVVQAFDDNYTNPNLPSLTSAADNFGINYGMGGIVSEILANRFGVGPMKDCTECKYEEFFLSSWTVGDPAMVVNNPASNCVDSDNEKIKNCDPATLAKYPDDPSNVYHSYLGDHVRFRVLHGGSDLHHVHHQHAHQWLHTSNSPNADYTDSQSIGPGSSFTMEMTYYGGGNLNQTVGDSIFHCHFYAHFASGMWSMFRVHDTLETGTRLHAEDGKDPETGKEWLKGQPVDGSRALPDGEIVAGTPIPGIVPMPTLPMPLLPAPVHLTNNGTSYEVLAQVKGKPTWVNPQQGGAPDPGSRNPGYPFFIPGIAGHRAPHPPLDFAYACSDNGKHCSPAIAGQAADLSLCGSGAKCEPLDGGLPRHLIVEPPANQPPNQASMPALNNSDFSKIVDALDAIQLAEEGTLVEQIAMNAHTQRLNPSCRPDGNCNGICDDNSAPCTVTTPKEKGLWQCGNPKTATCDVKQQVTYVLNGLKPQPGAPYADPCIAFDRKGGPAPNALTRRYRAADIQLDAIFNKEGWHFPQQRMISLWDDVKKFLDRSQPPEPLFFRANSGDCIEYTLANLVPNIYELDDFQVRTPTDILGQHIHLVKFDVTSSDGAGNGWNYEDGTFAPNEVTERIHAIRVYNGCKKPDPRDGTIECPIPKSIQAFGDGPGGTWVGAQATIQRWYSDPIYDNMGACSNNPDIACTITDSLKCGKGTCDVSAGFCANNMQKTCTAATALARCGAVGECVARYDRTLRTVFTHDHFGPSTHQQAGLYAGLVIEPEGSRWYNNEDVTGKVFGGFDAEKGKIIVNADRSDGGPTYWQAVIETRDKDKSFREFLLELQDSTLMYQPFAVPAFNLDAGSEAAQHQFTTTSFNKYCKDKDGKLLEPCGFCGSDGLCVDTATGKATDTACTVPAYLCPSGQTCTPQGPGKPAVCVDSEGNQGNGCVVPTCGSGQACQVVFGKMTACTPENFKHCRGMEYDDEKTQAWDTIQSCNLLSGFPGRAWASTPLDPPGGQEIVTFFGATNNFSFNYRNEPLYGRTTDPYTGALPAVCSNELTKACSNNGDCPTGTTDPCQWAGVCSDNKALCTTDNLTLCGAASATCDLPRANDLSYAYSSNPGIVRPNPRGAVCSNNLGKACQDNGDCPTGTTDPCQWAGFCSDNYALCTPTNLSLCGPGATCTGACDPRDQKPGDPPCDLSFPYKPLTAGIQKGDPFTPLLRAYAGDDVQIRTLTGAHLNPHNFTIQGMNWLMEPSFVDSGWRNSEVMGISEHFELISRIPPAFSPGSTDFLYQPGAAALEQAGGNWGLVRAYSQKQPDLYPLPQNQQPAAASFGVCPTKQPEGTTVRSYDVVALTAQQALGGDLIYNNGSTVGSELNDPNAILFFRKEKLTCPKDKTLTSCTFGGGKPEPLVLRANAGDCIKVTLYNAIDVADLGTGAPSPSATVPYGCGTGCQQAESAVSAQVGFRPQLVAFDAQVSGGANVGLNAMSTDGKQIQTVGPPSSDNQVKTVEYTWYAGNIDAKAKTEGTRYIPVEFGASNLMTPDVMNHYIHGLIGGLVIEPFGSTWDEKAGVEAVVQHDGSFREFVVFTQDNFTKPPINSDFTPFEAVNYGSEVLATNVPSVAIRFCEGCASEDVACSFTDKPFQGTPAACTQASFTPQTPTFTACAKESVRFRVLHPGGINTDHVFEIFGHNWSEAPYMTEYDHCEPAPTTQTNLWASTQQGTTNLCANQAYTLEELAPKDRSQGTWQASLNAWQGSRMGHGPGNHLDILIAQAGGPFHRTGTYMYRTFPAMHFSGGVWGFFQVVPEDDPKCVNSKPDKALKNQWEVSKP